MTLDRAGEGRGGRRCWRPAARIAGVAAKQYMQAGGGRVNAAIEAAIDANDMLDMGRNLHILEKSGDATRSIRSLSPTRRTRGRAADSPT